jgi:hypothetical protein
LPIRGSTGIKMSTLMELFAQITNNIPGDVGRLLPEFLLRAFLPPGLNPSSFSLPPINRPTSTTPQHGSPGN